MLNANRAKSYGPNGFLCFGTLPDEDLFDLKNDPGCINNLATAPTQQTRRDALEALLLSELKE